MASGGAGGELRALYAWLDAVPLSRPRRNIARDFSDGVLAAEVVKFFFPTMVQLHSYVPTSSTPQKLANWGHLNRKVLRKLNLCVPEQLIQQVVQCRLGSVEHMLLLLRQKIEEKQKRSKDSGARAPLTEVNYLETGYSKAKAGCDQAPRADTNICLQLAEKEQALLLAQETIQILQLKVRRLEQLLQLKNVWIDDLSRQLQQCQQH